MWTARSRWSGRWWVWLLFVAGWAAPVGAQVIETVGTRALGMGGAFVAVADDSTSGYWNPAGQVTGATFDIGLGWAPIETVVGRGKTFGPGSAASGVSSVFFGIVTPAIGGLYYRQQVAAVVPIADPTAGGVADRQDHRTQGVALSSLVVQQYGATLAQTLLPGIVLGATLKGVSGAMALETGSTTEAPEDLLRQAEQLETTSAGTKFDIDLGVMVAGGPLRIGLLARNLRESEFVVDGSQVAALSRQVRLGVALVPGGDALAYATDPAGAIVAVDVDLTRTPTATGERRMVAVGFEKWLLRRRLGLRLGGRANTVEELRPVAAGGVSVGIVKSLIVEGQYTGGHRDGDRGWSVSGRWAF